MSGVEQVVTGEAVEVELPVARLGTRLVAVAIDVAAQFVLLSVLLSGVGAVLVTADDALAATMFVGVLVILFLVWPVTFETLSRGRSLGKLAMGLRVVRDDGGPIRFRQALVRGLVGFAFEWPGIFFAPLTWIFGMVTMLFNPRGKRLGDLAAGTVVLHERLPDRGGYAPRLPAPLAPWARTLDLTGVDDALALAIRQFLSRSQELTPTARDDLGGRLAAEVASVTTPPPPPGTPGWAYLVAVLAERRRRETARLAERRAVVASVGLDLDAAPAVGVGVGGSTAIDRTSAWVDPAAWAAPGTAGTTAREQAPTGFVAPS